MKEPWPNVSELDSRMSKLGSSPGRVTALCYWTGHYILTVPLSKCMGAGKIIAGKVIIIIPSRRMRNTSHGVPLLGLFLPESSYL